ncbi:uncharacterized protein LOC124369186 isoform X2 [Homalodisca vitripennis]|uniref:uncharacterized protein LOC124369186 isoform X2 n=1 Tax=Homalodisca vitripennis TaxID=197043 RepID=UPI001EEA4A65|nr:uncharacterized protein LOC124369186 isoform X2 [Homalodisca vitripennis]
MQCHLVSLVPSELFLCPWMKLIGTAGAVIIKQQSSPLYASQYGNFATFKNVRYKRTN